ncbi:SGNH/GDSL hydrolase family protein [Streptomyces palmae]|uniref:SGNH/GDSL hydrolase family protein n=2 Tax=Streptomyces palmae TaxID=1701085 RepID=A0A4Z0FY08_9ACTN|nr:SGNH/GDSL hydrolase family protein [Streptomyces palmae]
MPRRAAFAVLAALVAVVALVSTAIFVGVGRGAGVLDTRPRERHDPVAPATTGSWVGTWSASAAAAEPNSYQGYPGMSIRNVLHTSIGGNSVRVHLSNLYGTRPLSITHASVAVAAAPSTPSAASGTMRRLTFGERTGVTIPAGRSVVSDAVRLTVPDAADLLVTTYSPTPSGSVTYHPHARQTSYLARGDRTEDAFGLGYTEQSPYWRYVTAVDVWSKEAQGSVAVLGDSITDGITSTAGANHRWPDYLATRLRAEPGAPRYGVLNQGISGNQVLTDGPGFPPDNPAALNRITREVLSRGDVRTVIVELGINDIIRPPRKANARQIVDGLRRLTELAHSRGIKVVGGTLTPFEGHRGCTPRLNAMRQQVNREIRAGGVFDVVVDFDRALRDPSAPQRLRPEYDSGDHLHPSDRGYEAMARAFDLDILRQTRDATL